MNKNTFKTNKTYVTVTKKRRNTRMFNKKSHKKRKQVKQSKTKKIKKIGGDIKSNNIFKYIKSIGFELETTGLIKLTKTKNEETNQDILVNSSLTNNDLEFGYDDPNEIIFIVDEPDEKFKITSDTNDDSNFNKELTNVYKSFKSKDNDNETDVYDEEQNNEDEDDGEDDEGDDDTNNCENVYVTLEIQDFGNFQIKFKENIDSELNNCGTFTDTEFISTFYKPTQNNDIIKYYLFKTIKQINNHLNKLKTYDNNKLIIGDNISEEIREINIKKAYVLPNTSLIYFTPLKYIDQNYNINEDLLFVTQMTFSCNVLYTFRIMIQLLTLVKNDEIKLKNMGKNKELIDIDTDMGNIRDVSELTNKLFNNYQMKQTEEMYKFPLQNEDVRYVKSYMFLIFYKLYIYLNYYVNNNSLLKYNLSFAVRHENNVLYEKVDEYLRKIFSNNFSGKPEEYINQKIKSILSQLLDTNIMNNYFYIKDDVISLHKQLLQSNDVEANFGRPEYSIMSYFEYFLTNKRDWLTDNDIDTKSTKFSLENNDVIIEFRDFPKFLLMEIYLTGSQEIKTNLDFAIEDNAPSIPIGIFNKYMSENGY